MQTAVRRFSIPTKLIFALLCLIWCAGVGRGQTATFPPTTGGSFNPASPGPIGGTTPAAINGTTGNFSSTVMIGNVYYATATDAGVRAAISALTTLGGGNVILPSGTITLSSSLPCGTDVHVYGVQPILTNWTGAGFNLGATGTILTGSGFPAFACNNTPVGTGSGYQAAAQVQGFQVHDVGFTGFTRAFDIGAQNSPGCYWCVFDNLYLSGMTDWGMVLQNPNQTHLNGIFSVDNTTGDILIQSSVESSVYEPGNSYLEFIYSNPLNNNSHGIVLAAPGSDGGNGSMLNLIHMVNVQVNRFGDTLVSQSATMSNSSTSIGVTDLSKFSVGMPLYFTSTANGFTANQLYFILSVSGSSGAGNITLGTSYYATSAITATGNTAITLNTYGFCNMEVRASNAQGSSRIYQTNFDGVDYEAASASSTCGLYQEESLESSFHQNGQAAFGTRPYFSYRSSTYGNIVTNQPVYYDIDAASVSGLIWPGSRNPAYNRSPAGIVYDNVNSVAGLQLTSGAASSLPDLYSRSAFLYPNTGIGERIFPRDTAITLGGAQTGAIIFNGSSGVTYTLPILDNGGTPSASFQGSRYLICNASAANTLAIATQSSQTLNNISAKTSTAIPINSCMEFIGSITVGGTLFWSVFVSASVP